MLRIGIGLAAVALAAQAQTAGAWNTVSDRRGASLQVPAGWNAAADPNSTRINISGPAGERMVVWPVFMAETLTGQSAAAMLARVAPKLDPGMAWLGAPAPAGASAVRLAGEANGQAAVASMAWVNSPRGSAVYFVMSAAPLTRYAVAAPTFARIFGSLTLTPPAAAKLQGVRWSDPREQAFSLEVPVNWRMEGGTFRRAAVDLVHAFSMTSPDGSIRLTGGDPEMPPFVMPSQTLQWTGFREGTWYSPGYGVRMMVRRYTPGVAFAKSYVQSKVAQGCTNLQFTQEQDRTREFAAVNAQYAQFRQMGMDLQLTGGDVSFTCQRGGQMVMGYYFATTVMTQTGGNGIWMVDQLYGYTAQGGSEEEAARALSLVLETFQFNPQWLQMQQGVAMQTSKIVSQTQSEISRMSRSSFEYRQRVTSESTRKFSNAMLGLVDARDPATGREMKVDNAANYHWIDVSGRIIGTQTDTKPAGIDARMLVTLP